MGRQAVAVGAKPRRKPANQIQTIVFLPATASCLASRGLSSPLSHWARRGSARRGGRLLEGAGTMLVARRPVDYSTQDITADLFRKASVSCTFGRTATRAPSLETEMSAPNFR